MINLVSAALAPVFALLLYVYFRDKYEKEPIWLLLAVFFSGALTTVPVIFIESALSDFYFIQLSHYQAISAAAYNAFVVAAFTEESFKFLAFFILVWRSRHFNEKFDGIVYAVFISLGFAAVENILYVLQHGYETAALRAFTAVPAHAVFGVSMGYFFGIAKIKKQRIVLNIFIGFFSAFLLHGVYDFVLMSENNILLLAFIPYVLWIFYFAHRRMKRHSDSSRFRLEKPELH